MLNLRDPEQTTFIISIIAGIIGGFVAGYGGTIGSHRWANNARTRVGGIDPPERTSATKKQGHQ